MKEFKYFAKHSFIFISSLLLWKYISSFEIVEPYLRFIQRILIGVVPVLIFYDIYRVHKIAIKAKEQNLEMPEKLANRYGKDITKLEVESLLLVARISICIVFCWAIFISWYSLAS